MPIDIRQAIKGIVFAAAFLAQLYPATASAQVSDDIVAATTGLWLVASEDGSPGCRLTFEKDQTIGGYALKEENPCAGPLHDNVYSWGFGEGTLELRDATRKVLMSFEEQEGGPWRTPDGVTPRIYLVPDPGAMQSVPLSKNLTGTNWTLTDKKGKLLCGIRLSDKRVPDYDEGFTLETSKDCGAAVKKTKISLWQVFEISLIFVGGEDWAFTLHLQPDGSFLSDDGKYRLVKAKI